MEDESCTSTQLAGTIPDELPGLEPEATPRLRRARKASSKNLENQLLANPDLKRTLEDDNWERRTKKPLDDDQKEKLKKDKEEKRQAKQRLKQEQEELKERQRLEQEQQKEKARLEKDLKHQRKLELKLKIEAERQEKLLQKQENAMKKQEELKRKQEDAQRKQEERALKLKLQEEDRLRKTEEKLQQAALKLAQQEERRLKLEEKTEPRPNCKQLTEFFKVRPSSDQSRESTESADIEPMKIDSYSPEDWRDFWKTQAYLPEATRQPFIFIHDSALKPYFVGTRSQTRLHRDFLRLIDCVDYERDSEDEFEEQNAEDLEEEQLSSDEESEDSDESVAEFVVPDTYLSDAEGSQDERPEVQLITSEVKPITFIDPERLQALSAISITGGQFPIHANPPKCSIKDENWVPDLLEILEGRASKTEVLNLLRER